MAKKKKNLTYIKSFRLHKNDIDILKGKAKADKIKSLSRVLRDIIRSA